QSSGALTLSASKISLGTPDGVAAGLVLSEAALAALNVDDFTLRSRQGIDLFGNVSGDFRDLVLDTPQLAGHGVDTDVARLTAQTATLLNSSGATNMAAASGTGRLALSATDVKIDSGHIDVSGFSNVALTAAHDVVAMSTEGSALNVAGDLDITAARLTGTAG